MPGKKVKVRKYSSVSRLKDMLDILRKHEVVRGLNPEKLRLILEDLGPTFVKIGQIMSMRSDLLPQEYCTELQKLRNDVAPMDLDRVERVLEREYGEDWSRKFRNISRTPLGSASIAQVHGAELADGQRVVLKVQRPYIREIMSKDVVFLRHAVRLLEIVPKLSETIDFNMLLDEMWAVAQQEMDFIVEAQHLERFAKCNRDVAYVACPTVYQELSTAHVLVMEFVEGVPIDEVETLTSMGYDMDEIGEKLADNYIKQILDDGFFHADPHPGNIRIRDGKIVWIDLGMMGTLSNRDRDLFKKAVLSIVNRDVYELEMALLSIGVTREKVSHTELYEDINLFLARYATADLAELELGPVLSEMMDMASRHHISMPPGVTMLARGIVTIEGVLKFCSPNTNLLQILANHYSELAFDQLDMAKESARAVKKLYHAVNRLGELPGYLSDMCKMTVRGQTKVNLELTGSEEPLRKLSRIINRVTIGIIDAGLLVSSGLLSTTNMNPKFMGVPALGAIGYFIALVLSVYLVFSFKWGKGK